VIGIAASLFYGNAILKVGPTYPYNSPNAPYSSLQYAVTVTCYLDGCPPVACPSWGCGTMTTTTVSAYLHSTQAVQTFVGYVKILTGAPSGVYFFDVGSVQYHLVFCNCPATEVCNCPNIPVLSDGQRLQVIGTIVTPSTYGSVWAPGGDIYVQSWALA
jgi:hypothetical protein